MTADGAARPAPVTLAQAARVWARVGLLSFGGPAGQIALMHRILVEEKRWVGEARFLHALSFCTLLPGPEAQQLATYLGWLLHRNPGGLVAGGLFVLPGVAAILGLSLVYVALGTVPAVAGLFLGLKCAVLAIVLQALLRIGSRALRDQLTRAVAALAFVAIFVFDAPFPLIVLAAGLAGYLGVRAAAPRAAAPVPAGLSDADSLIGAGVPDHARPDAARTSRVALALLLLWLAPVAALIALRGEGDVFAAIGLFFSKMALVTFGGAYAVLAYVAQEAVETYGWLRANEMLDGLGMAETTPGPLIMVVQFVGFMGAYRAPGALAPWLAGTLGGLLATWVTFAPCFLWIFAGAPYVEALRENRALSGALAAITAAVVGVILNLTLWFATHALFARVETWRPGLGIALEWPVLDSVQGPALALSAAAVLAVIRWRAGIVPTLALCALAGIALRMAGAA